MNRKSRQRLIPTFIESKSTKRPKKKKKKKSKTTVAKLELKDLIQSFFYSLIDPTVRGRIKITRKKTKKKKKKEEMSFDMSSAQTFGPVCGPNGCC